ncbi:hypothetical protein E4U33_000414, partial [Claviceps sp. LM78 group G4]
IVITDKLSKNGAQHDRDTTLSTGNNNQIPGAKGGVIAERKRNEATHERSKPDQTTSQ